MNVKAFALGAALVLSGCNSDNNSTYGQFYGIMKTSIAASMGDHKVSRDQAAAIAYASMGWRLDGGNENIIILATDSAGEQLWTSAARIVLVTRDGRLVRTVGLPHDLAGLTPRGGAAQSPAVALQGPFTIGYLADFADEGQYGVTIGCRSHAAARQAVRILGRSIATTRVDEDCEAPVMGWRFTNSYWVDGDGMVWRTRQHIHPRSGTMETEILRPPG